MIPIAGVLLLIVVVFTIAVVVSNPEVFNLSIFGANIPVTAAGVYFVGAGAMLVLILAALLLRRGLKREMRRRRQVKALRTAAGGSTRPSPSQPEVTDAPERAKDDSSPTLSRDAARESPEVQRGDRGTGRASGATGAGASAMTATPDASADEPQGSDHEPEDGGVEPEVSAAERRALLDEAEELTGDGRDR